MMSIRNPLAGVIFLLAQEQADEWQGSMMAQCDLRHPYNGRRQAAVEPIAVSPPGGAPC